MKIAFVVVAGLLSSAALAADTPPSAAPAEAVPEKKICHNEEPALGSNLMRRVCKTRAEWAQLAHDKQSTGDQINVNKFRDMSTQFAAPH